MPLQTLTSLGGPLFVKAAPCAFCGSPSVCLCDWPVEKPMRVLVENLEIGDRLTTAHEIGSWRPGETAELAVIAEADRGLMGLQFRMFDRKGVRIKPGQLRSFRFAASATAMALRPATCDIPACDLHRRNVGDGRNYCREHWDAWERAA